MQYQLLQLRKYYKIQDMKEGKAHVLLPLPTSLPIPHWTKTYISRAFLFSIWLTAKPNPNTEKDKCKRCPDFQFSLFIFSSIWENNRKSVFILVEPSLRKILLTDVYAANKQRRQKIRSCDTRFVGNHYFQFLEVHDDIPVAHATKIKCQLIHGSSLVISEYRKNESCFTKLLV